MTKTENVLSLGWLHNVHST